MTVQKPSLLGSKVQALPPALHRDLEAGRAGILIPFIQMHKQVQRRK